MAETIVKASIAVGDKTITFEGPRDFVESQVARYSNDVPSVSQAKAGKEDHRIGTTSDRSERDVVEQKRPRNHPETVAVLAFCLAENGTTEFTEDDIRRAYIRAGVRPPKVVSQAIRDAKNNYDLIEAGSQKGSYRLSPHGDRTVRFDLPPRD